ncbi:uncharacterized protein [Typha latifolia]|uniref:uncharacterized protein n=1 Tax=Typha latifolia TaxID=4733 RepID=UPI003C2EAC02
MAAAEARAAWQRAANRCLVQEDAKRAPKLACCPSSSAQQHDINKGNASNAQDHPIPSFMPLNWKPMNSNLPPETKWWLQLQPNLRYQKDFVCEHLNFLDDKVESAVSESKLSGEPISEAILEQPWTVSTAFMNHCSEKKVDKLETIPSYSQNPQMHRLDIRNHHYKDEKPMDRNSISPFISNKTEKASVEMDSPWTRCNGCEPWWRIADKNELASLVAQKSLEHIENCDLPRPTQTIHFRRDPLSGFEMIDTANRIFSSSFSLRPGFGDPIDYPEDDYKSGSTDEKKWSSGRGDWLMYDNEILYSGPQVYVNTGNDPPESKLTYESEPSRDRLLEALCHSQTRARKAELAAQKANDEKEHVVKLLFRQASHLFAYKQWLQMLQLESLCLQLKINEHQIASLFPVLPWMPLKDKSYVRDGRNSVRRKGKKQKSSIGIGIGIGKYAMFFAVGLGIAGAGLLLGWTLGWLLAKL